LCEAIEERARGRQVFAEGRPYRGRFGHGAGLTFELGGQRGERTLDLGHDAATHRGVVAAEDAVADEQPGHVDRAGADETPRRQPRNGAPGKRVRHWRTL
jgi:acyl dehydratase